jgi:flagellar hook-associated protein 1
MSLSGALNTALAGLQVSQQALQVVSGNVANAQTPGYDNETLTQIATGTGTATSVRSTAIDRDLDTLVQTQLQTATSGGAFADQLSSMYQQLQAIYGQPGSSTGLDTLFNNFTASLQTLAASPSSFSAQSGAVNSAQLLAQQLNTMSNSIQSLRESAEQGIAADVATANNDMQQIASINQQVTTADPNDPATATLLDQRDQLVSQLATLMDVKVVQGQFNQITVFTGNGTQLVGSQAAQLSFNAQGNLTPNSQFNDNPNLSTVGTITLTNPGGGSINLSATGAIQSGQIAAYVQMRDQVLPQAQTQLDEFAAKMSQAISDQTTQGTAVTVGPQTGFTIDTTPLQTGNTIQLTYTDASNTQHTITIVRVDNSSVLPLPNNSSDPNNQTIGVNFNGGSLSSPTSTVISQLNTALASTGLQFSNTGNTLQVLNNGTVNLTVNSLSETATATSLTGGSPQLPLFVDTTSPFTNAVTPGGSEETGFAQRITVNPTLLSNPGDLVTYSTNPPTAAGDNTRPTFLYNQMTQATPQFSPATGIGTAAQPLSATLSTYIGAVMTQQGQAAANATSLQQGQDVVVQSLQQRMNTVSGVNVDQEMADLLTLQNTYAANARVFSTVQEMFQTLLQSATS